MYKFSKKSLAKLQQAHPDLEAILTLALSRSKVDFGISETARAFEKQLAYFLADPPATTLDPRDPEKIKHAKHVITEARPQAMAADIYVYVDGLPMLTYDIPHLCYLAGVIDGASRSLLKDNITTHFIRWGGNWDGDGCIMKDQNFQDLPHFELVAA